MPGYLATSNTLIDEHGAEVTALLDFELAGADFRLEATMRWLAAAGVDERVAVTIKSVMLEA